MSKKTYRVKARVVGYQTYEIDAESVADAEELYPFGVLVYDDVEHDYIDSVVEIDTADPEVTEFLENEDHIDRLGERMGWK